VRVHDGGGVRHTGRESRGWGSLNVYLRHRVGLKQSRGRIRGRHYKAKKKKILKSPRLKVHYENGQKRQPSKAESVVKRDTVGMSKGA